RLCNPQAASMAVSETFSAVFRNTSLTMRQRFTPDSACSTCTRTRPNFRLVRFSATVSSRLRGFFFRLARLGHGWLVPLEAAILVQHRAGRIGDVLLVGNRLVRYPALVGLAQKVDTPAVGSSDDHVLVAVPFLPPAVVRPLFFRVFRPLATALGPIDDAPRPLRRRCGGPGKGLRVAFREDAQVVECLTEYGQEPLEPGVYPRQTQTEEFRQDDLQGGGLEVDKEEQEFLFRARKHSLASCSGGALAGPASDGPVWRVQTFVGKGEGRQQVFKFEERETGKSQQPLPVAP